MSDEESEGGKGYRVSNRRKVGEAAEPTPLGDNAGVYIPQPEQPIEPKLAFGDFIMSLGTSAYISLGHLQDPTFGPAEPDLAAARQIIDILEMLHEKTRGNLDEEEDRLLAGLTYELKMAFVETARRS
jgi:hypothetical protein